MSAVGSSAAADVRVRARARVPGAARASVSARELLVCALAFGVLALAMCAAHIRSGGLYYDDWNLLALARFPAPGGLLHSLQLNYGQRPGQVLYYAALDQMLGQDAAARLALAAAALVLEATCLYWLLRELSLAARHAAAIAALVLIFPFSDSVWLWGVLSLSTLAIAAWLLGAILALRALQASGRRALALQGASLSLFLASIVSYEVFAVAGCLTGLLYVRSVGLARARARWALDVLIIVFALAVTRAALPTDVATPSRVQSLAGIATHARLIAGGGLRVTGAAALPVRGVSGWIGTGLLLAVLAGGWAMRVRLPAGDPDGEQLRRWLAIAAAGALVAIASWAVYIPGSDHYVPSIAGTVNRINALAATGIAIVVYSSVVLLACLLSRLLRLPAVAASVGVGAAVLALGGAYLGRAAADTRAWNAAAADQRKVLADLHLALARPPRDAAVYAFDAPQTVGPGVPVLDTTLDLTSAMRISYASPQLVGVPLAGRTSVACGPRGPLAAGVAGAYGEAYLVDVRARRAVRVTDRAQCVALVEGGCAAGAQTLRPVQAARGRRAPTASLRTPRTCGARRQRRRSRDARAAPAVPLPGRRSGRPTSSAPRPSATGPDPSR